MTYREYTMKLPTLQRLENRCGGELRCHHSNCQKKIKIGDAVISRIGRHGLHSNIYHRQCYLDSFC